MYISIIQILLEYHLRGAYQAGRGSPIEVFSMYLYCKYAKIQIQIGRESVVQKCSLLSSEDGCRIKDIRKQHLFEQWFTNDPETPPTF